MNYTQTLEYIHSTPKFARVLGNDMLKKLLGFMGNPQRTLRFIHIAGTNGKGSAAKLLSEILRRAGFKTGLFTSPYIERFNERIMIDGVQIPDSELAGTATYVRGIIEENDAPVSEFALDTAIAFKYFADNKADIVVLETGLGGRIDATNVIDESVVSLIMHISYDHMQYLGDTLDKIAAEKCGIIKENGTVVAYPEQDEEVWEVIESTCGEKNARLYKAAAFERTDGGLIYKGKDYALSLKGAYQPYNAAAVLECVYALRDKGFDIPEESVRKALASAKWAARFEFVRDDLIIDGGHNIDGVRALAESLAELKKPVTLVTAMMSDKSVDECAGILDKIAENVIATQIDMPRCMSAEELAEKYRAAFVCPNPADALKKAMEINTGVVCVCGSLYLCGEIKRLLRKSEQES